MTEVAILGAGPAGMMAALAVERSGHQPVIYSREISRSPVNLDTFLLEPLPEVCDAEPDDHILFAFEGHARGYAQKVYGQPTAEVSWNSVRWGAQSAWWLSEVYQKLYSRFEHDIVLSLVDPSEALNLVEQYALVISTLPAKELCTDWNHQFKEVTTWLAREYRPHDNNPGRDRLVYNGDSKTSWYRYSLLRGWHTWEYTERPEILGHTIVPGRKYVDTDCNCIPSLARVGRMAQHRRGVMNHHAYNQTISCLVGQGLGKED